MSRKIHRVLEYTWLTLTIVLLIFAIKNSIVFGLAESITGYILALLCFLFYVMRRNERLKNKGK